ncbi:hypothetical protein K402DRAFT_401748 [Aulographum hederae CBS 113979]|uniref:Uncharacterized protein n=1 Tax=Aulographum hederae CBS 113979 TaxID=1176131 RepID=A0A6G1H9F2_9PEZI|nr:hypothetical protein K402DRAFT_401748 [Aulographum hederae CBS 113979]
MRSSSYLPLIASVASATLFERRACHADNCARAITGTAIAALVSVHQSDCSSFLSATVTPATSTSTITIYVTSPAAAKRSPVAAPAIEERDVTVTPSSIPVYASAACHGANSASRYASACSCAGITPTTTTLPTPVATSTTTVTVSGAWACTNPGTCDSFSPCGASTSNTTDPDTCLCFFMSGKLNTACMRGGTPCGVACTEDADCGSDEVCVGPTCCGMNCVPKSAGDTCVNGASVKRMFGAGIGRRVPTIGGI